jgi:hypothetical protein
VTSRGRDNERRCDGCQNAREALQPDAPAEVAEEVERVLSRDARRPDEP